jgi:Spy/CpxP family protein refolding chaperone
MKANKLILPGLFTVLLALSGASYAHDGNGCNQDGGAHDGDRPHAALSDEKRQLLHETMKKVFEQDKAQIEQMHKLHKEMHDVLAAENFDQHKFMALGSQIGKIHDKIHRDRMQAFASIAGQFTPAEREMLVRMHHHHHPHGHDGQGWHHDGDGHAMSNGPAQSNEDYHPYPSR